MHEYSVVSELISALLPKLEEHAGRISAVILVKGELRILSDIALKNAFELLAQGTRLEGSELVIEPVEVRVRCRACGYEGAVDHVREESFHFAIPILSCPTCGAEVDVEAGRELYVDRVTIQTEAPAEAP
jgi:hydrogenase nickel incorporation protein HypA/HybF